MLCLRHCVNHGSPGVHDGAATFAAPDGNVLLVLNHEVRGGPDDDGAVPHLRGYTWRDDAGGGCTVVKTTPDGELIRETVTLAGTSTNCAGGVTPWGTWLTCEETDKNGHGYVFEVDPVDLTANRDPRPIKALGRFGELIVSTDGDGDNHLPGVTADGHVFAIARSQMGSEFTGPTFFPDGRVLFAGVQQQPGTLFAITGPW